MSSFAPISILLSHTQHLILTKKINSVPGPAQSVDNLVASKEVKAKDSPQNLFGNTFSKLCHCLSHRTKIRLFTTKGEIIFIMRLNQDDIKLNGIFWHLFTFSYKNVLFHIVSRRNNDLQLHCLSNYCTVFWMLKLSKFRWLSCLFNLFVTCNHSESAGIEKTSYLNCSRYPDFFWIKFISKPKEKVEIK